MQKVIFVIGANAAGKTYFIEHHLASEKAVVLNIYDYQQKVYDEHGNKELITFEEQFRCLKKANEKHLHDIINELKLSVQYVSMSYSQISTSGCSESCKESFGLAASAKYSGE